jgi:hypothetical protein
MATLDLFLAQLVDPFRIVLVAGLVLTMLRTRTATGIWLPLAAGVAFIAVLIPTTLTAGQGDLARQVGVGLVSTAVLVAVGLAVRALVLRLYGR